jgi:hypothetical protein
MKAFQATSPAVEVDGETVLAVVAGMGTNKARADRILGSHGLHDVKPGSWYSQQKWLDAFREIAETVGPNTLYQIIEQALGAIDVAYKMNHRGGEIGSYQFHSTSPKSGKLVCHNPYPSDFDRGIVQAMANRFKPQGSFVSVTLDETQPTRKTGGESCTFLVSW